MHLRTVFKFHQCYVYIFCQDEQSKYKEKIGKVAFFNFITPYDANSYLDEFVFVDEGVSQALDGFITSICCLSSEKETK